MTGNFEVAPPGTQALIDKAKELLKVAVCPDTNCIQGVIAPDGYQCQWCHEREVLCG